MDFAQTKLIVFDLDGTLYEDTHHFDYYAEKLKAKLNQELAANFTKDYEAARAEKHTLKIGTVYDVKTDLILEQLENKVLKAYKWDGTAIDDLKVKELYPDPIKMDLDRMLNVGDLWWIPGAIARHYGLSNELSYEAFLETRDYMMSPEFEMAKIPDLKDVLEEVGSHVQVVLLTNSPQPDSEAILAKLELDHVFHKKIFRAQKPTYTIDRFREIKNEFRVDYKQILSIGDNWVNEIYPVRLLGCKTILIDPHKTYEDHSADVVVQKIADVLPIIKQLIK